MKKYIITIIITLFIIYCVIFPKEMAASTSAGLNLWYKNVLPTLLPFSILSYIIIYSDLYHVLFSKIQSLFRKNTSFQAELIYPFCLGFVFGFPIGAKLIADLYETGHITNHNMSRYTAICNQFGPAFVINYIGIAQLQDKIPGLCLIISIYLPSLLLLGISPILDHAHNKVCAKNPHSDTCNLKKKPASGSHINIKIIDTGIINGFETMLRIAGYIVLFSILSGALNQLLGQQARFASLVTGLLEVTTGVNKYTTSQLPLEIVFPMICGIVSFGGFCGIFQTKAIMKNCPFHITSYIFLKCICAITSIGIGSLFLRFI